MLQLNVGDVVRFNSGGKNMTVSQVNNSATVTAIWQQANGYGQIAISPQCLVLVRRHDAEHPQADEFKTFSGN
jgi:uncharacterized protein YodC (DUF2158 family)